MDLTDVLALAGAGLLLAGIGCVVYAFAGTLVAGGVVMVAVGFLLLLASRASTAEAS